MKFNECSFVFLFIVVVLNRLTHVEVAIDWTTGQLSNELKIARAEVRISTKNLANFSIYPFSAVRRRWNWLKPTTIRKSKSTRMQIVGQENLHQEAETWAKQSAMKKSSQNTSDSRSSKQKLSPLESNKIFLKGYASLKI